MLTLQDGVGHEELVPHGLSDADSPGALVCHLSERKGQRWEICGHRENRETDLIVNDAMRHLKIHLKIVSCLKLGYRRILGCIGSSQTAAEAAESPKRCMRDNNAA